MYGTIRHRLLFIQRRKWTQYSYKGGSGRSIAAINIALGINKLGKSVCLIDLDITSPGQMEIIRQYCDDEAEPGCFIQDILRSRVLDEDGNEEYW